MRTCEMTLDAGAIERGSEFVKAVVTGFSVKDSLSLLRLENIFLKSFDITDVKPLKGDHLTRAVGRIAGTKGKTKQALEANTRTRIVLEGRKWRLFQATHNLMSFCLLRFAVILRGWTPFCDQGRSPLLTLLRRRERAYLGIKRQRDASD